MNVNTYFMPTPQFSVSNLAAENFTHTGYVLHVRHSFYIHWWYYEMKRTAIYDIQCILIFLLLIRHRINKYVEEREFVRMYECIIVQSACHWLQVPTFFLLLKRERQPTEMFRGLARRFNICLSTRIYPIHSHVLHWLTS